MSLCIFAGPTLRADAVEAHLPGAILLPPARQGDILRAMDRHNPSAIGIIDGFFEQTPAVWHKEILWALTHGIAVYGAASMGALRAAELEPFGMVGVGRVFEAYKAGRFAPYEGEPFEDDDEVAVSHGPAELGYPGSTALVDMRATLAAACEAGIITPPLRDSLAATAKSTFYKDRHYAELLARARADRLDDMALDAFEGWLSHAKVEQKRLDAEELLVMMQRIEISSFPARFHFEHTSVWEAALRSLEPAPQD